MHILDYTDSEMLSTSAKLGYKCTPLERFQEIQHENVIFMNIETMFGNTTKDYIILKYSNWLCDFANLYHYFKLNTLPGVVQQSDEKYK